MLAVQDGTRSQIHLTGNPLNSFALLWYLFIFDISRLCCLLVNILVCVAQIVTVPLCLVGWCWSVGWGISMVNIASKQQIDR